MLFSWRRLLNKLGCFRKVCCFIKGFNKYNLNVGVKTIHRIEGGSGGITATTYEKVFRALDIDMVEVVRYLGEKEQQGKLIPV